MKVKIIKSKRPTYWYADKIGQLFEVKDYNNTDYRTVGSGYYISKSDCEIVENELSDNTEEDMYNNKKNKIKYIKITNEGQSTYKVGNVYKAKYIENCDMYAITDKKCSIVIGYIDSSDCIPIDKKDLMVVGSKVKLKKKYYNVIDKKEINNFKGKILTIKNIYEDEHGKWYDFEENDLFGWKQHMFKPYLDN